MQRPKKTSLICLNNRLNPKCVTDPAAPIAIGRRNQETMAGWSRAKDGED